MSRTQLLALGLSPDSVDYSLALGKLTAIHRGVYLIGGAIDTVAAREFAAVLACGPQATLSHRSAAYRLELLPRPETDEEIDVTVTARRPESRPGIRVHRAGSLVPGEAHVRDGLRVTTVRRTLLDLAGVAPGRELERALATAKATGRANPRGLHLYLGTHRHRKGTGALRRLLAAEPGPALTRSEAEERLLGLIRPSGLPEPRLNARVGRFEVDFWWEPQRLVVEVDGWRFHGDRESAERDSLRDAELAGLGIRVIRVSWRQLVEGPERVLARIRRALAVAPQTEVGEEAARPPQRM